MQIVNMFKPQWIMLKTSAQAAINLRYGQRTRLHLFSPVGGPGGSGAWDARGCSDKDPKATALVSVCDNTWKLAGEKSSVVTATVQVAQRSIH